SLHLRASDRDVTCRDVRTPPRGTTRMSPILKACVVCCRLASPGSHRCAEHAIRRDNGHARRKRLARELLEAEHACWICGQPARAGDPLTIDHIVPVSLGGETSLANLRPRIGRLTRAEVQIREGPATPSGLVIDSTSLTRKEAAR